MKQTKMTILYADITLVSWDMHTGVADIYVKKQGPENLG